MSKLDIITVLNSEELFKPLLGRNPRTWYNWRVFLKAVFALPMTQKELEVYQTYSGRKRPPRKRPEEVYAICGRRSGKSFIVSLIAAYVVLFEDFWKDTLAPGERVMFPIIATDRTQARVILDYINGILHSKKVTRDLIVKDNLEEIELRNGVTISIKTPSFRSIRGPKYIGAALDELAFWRDYSTAANPADEIIKAIRPAIVDGGILFGISSAFARAGVLYEEYVENYGKEKSSTLVWQAGTRDMNPTFNQKKIDKAMKKDESHAKAEYLSEWRDDLSALLPAQAVEDCIIIGRRNQPPAYGIEYYAFCDPSGGKHDHMTLAIAHKSRMGMVVIDALFDVEPPFSPAEVVTQFAVQLRKYAINTLWVDRYGGEWVKEAFYKVEVYLRYSELSASELYLNFLPEITNQTVELPENRSLRNQLLSLMRKTSAGGKDSVIASPGLGGHSDLANAVAGVAWVVRHKGGGKAELIS